MIPEFQNCKSSGTKTPAQIFRSLQPWLLDFIPVFKCNASGIEKAFLIFHYAAGQAWANAFTEKETTFVKITSVTNGEVAVDGKAYHGVIFQGKLHLIEQRKVTAPFNRAKFCQLMGFAEPSEPAPASSSGSEDTGPSEEELAAIAERQKQREADLAALPRTFHRPQIFGYLTFF